MENLNKKSELIVATSTQEQVNIIKNFYGKTKKPLDFYSYYNYVVCTPQSIKDGNMLFYSVIENVFTDLPIIEFEQWEALPNEEFVLPKKWAVRGFEEGDKKLANYANKYGALPPYTGHKSFHHFPPADGGSVTTAGVLYAGYTEITYEQFEKYVLKQDNMEEIIQYRVKPEFNKVSKILYETFNRDAFGGYARFDTKSVLKEQYEKAGVLDIWFEPQTKKSFTLPEINGYKGEDKGDYLLYGCAKLPVAWFTATYSSPWNREIKTLELSSGVKIKENELNQIRTYLKHR